MGNIVTVMLSENIEEVTQPDGTTVPMLVETHFQMNYTNGEWKRIKKNRRIITEESTSTTTPTPSVTATASNWKKIKEIFIELQLYRSIILSFFGWQCFEKLCSIDSKRIWIQKAKHGLCVPYGVSRLVYHVLVVKL